MLLKAFKDAEREENANKRPTLKGNKGVKKSIMANKNASSSKNDTEI